MRLDISMPSITMWTWIVLTASCLSTSEAFLRSAGTYSASFALPSSIRTPHGQKNHLTCLQQSSSSYFQALKRRDVEIPLMDMTTESSKDYDDSIIVPLPSSHLPEDLSTLNMYGMQLKVAIHKMMMEEATSKTGINTNDVSGDIFGALKGKEALYGHVIAKKKGSDDLVGAIGCAGEIVLAVPSPSVQMSDTDDGNPLFADAVSPGENNEDAPMTVLVKGAFRFVVKEVKQTFPFPIAIVDELLDEPPNVSESSAIARSEYDENDEDDEEDYDMYADLPPSELVPRTLAAMKAITDQGINTKPKEMSPLEQSILEQSSIPQGMVQGLSSMERSQAEEMAAVFDIFVASLIDIAPMPVDRYYAVALMGGEMAGLENSERRAILTTRNGVERLRLVLQKLEEKISMVQAKKLTDDIVGKSDEDSKDLKVS